MTLSLNSPLRELIDIPDRVEAADFVVKLDEGVARHAQTVRDYVVTDAIAEAVAQGVDLVGSALARQSSRGAFLDGSFGSGKSHYMAVLHLLLAGDLAARQISGLESVVAQRLSTLETELLVVDYNLLGARSFEDAIFRGYLDTVAQLHPSAPAPVLHASDGLIADARALRARMGDRSFFEGLGSGDSGWGDLGSSWDADTFDAAASLAPGSADRDRLVNDLAANYFASAVRTSEWLPMKDGLHALTAHAKSLGYKGLVFLIDEIVLWLGQRLGDENWVQGEIEKVVQLAENAAVNLPVPIVSFLARQRDLRDFLGTHITGAQRVAQGQLFAYWEDRFAKIRLHAADLPRIVKQRLLQPTSAEAAQVLAGALAEVKRDYTAWGYLLADEANADERAFADVYPFSPALVDTMVALSSLMQRERTALKLMAELLSCGRDTLTVRDVIPVGDLYEPIVLGGSQPLTDEMKQHFAISARFYRQKMLPFLLRKHGLREGEPSAWAASSAFVTEDRLAKTVLIAALAPEARSLSNLTAAKLAALNWGTINTFIPGAEAPQVIEYVRTWAAEFGEISVGDGADPIVTASLSGVDYDSVLDRVRHEDGTPARRELVRRLIGEELQLPADSLVGRGINHVWRGHKRPVTVRFGNVRDEAEVLDDDLLHQDAEWRVVIDFPYDSGNHSPSDDVARLRKLRDGAGSARTLAWIPNFLTDARQSDLGKLVLLEFLLTGARFEAHADHLAPSDRGPARQTLESQRSTLRDVVLGALRQAYGVNAPNESNVGDQLQGNEIFSALMPGLSIAPPPSGSLLDGLRHALVSAWAHEYPDHPDLGREELSTRRLAEAVDLVAATIEAGGRRQGLNAAEQRLAREVIAPLGLGEVNENILVADQARFRWGTSLARWESELGDGFTIGSLRGKFVDRGMTTAMEDAVIIVWALLGNVELGAASRVGELPDGARPRKADLPDAEAWASASARAGGIFGVAPESSITPRSVERFAEKVRTALRTSSTEEFVQLLEEHAALLAINPAAPTGRLASARRVLSLQRALASTTDAGSLITTLVQFDVPEELSALGRTVATASQLVAQLAGTDWGILTAAAARDDAGFADGLAALREAAALDESVIGLGHRLSDAAALARSLIMRAPEPTPSPAPAPAPAPAAGAAPVQQPRRQRRVPIAELDAALAAIRAEIAQASSSDGHVTLSWQVD